MDDKFELMRKKLAGEPIERKRKSNPDDPKAILIDGKLHKRYRDYCRFQKKKIGGLTEDLIELYLSKPDEIQNLINSQPINKGE